jgi:enterochelin esterase family protein
MKKSPLKEVKREEAAPTFPTLKQRLEEKEQALRHEIEQFLEVLKVLGTPMIAEPNVHFIYYNPTAQSVGVSGEFNQWTFTPMIPLGQTGIFYHTTECNGPARVEYKLVVDGQWIVDPFCQNRVDNGIGEQNSFFVAGDFQEPPELEWVAKMPHGRVEEFDFNSQLLNNQRRVYVYLPPGYAKSSSQRFPTFYVHDGGEYLSRARLATVLDNLCHSRSIPPLIAVMVDPVDRMAEYHTNERYAQFLEQELIPHIDRHYRTRAERGSRGVMGASMGGLISTYLALSHPHLFAKAAGQSSAFFLEQDKLTALVNGLTANVSFYFDVGAYEPQFIPAHHQLVPLLQAKGCPCLFQELEGGHNWTNWRAHLKDLLTFLWGKETAEGAKRLPARKKAGAPPKKQPVKRHQLANSRTLSRTKGAVQR